MMHPMHGCQVFSLFSFFFFLFSFSFFIPFQARRHITKCKLQKCRTNWRKPAIVYWHTGCQLSYRPQFFYNHMGYPKHITIKAILSQKTKISQSSTIQPIKGSFQLECLQKTLVITEKQNMLKPLIFCCQSSFNHSSSSAPVDVLALLLTTPKNTLSP